MNMSYQGIMALLNARRADPPVVIKTISIDKCKIIEEESKLLDETLIPLYSAIFTNKQQGTEMNLRHALPFKEKKTAMPVCNKLFNSSETVYRCYDCTTHEAAVLCITCFERGNHQGHRFAKIQSGGGNCDCGNPDAIGPQGFCMDHKGTAQIVEIDPQVYKFFDHHFKQIFIWILQLYKLELKTQSQGLLYHLLQILDQLNTESLFYNTLTNNFLFANDNQIADHILVIGSKTKNSPLSKKATELFLKMFSLEVFKQNMALLYLKAYNRLDNFEFTRFESLFIQLFANNDLVEKVVSRSGISLDPRERNYNANSYYGNLMFVGSIKEFAARTFFTPIINSGGVDCDISKNMYERCEQNNKRPEEIYKETINTENAFYSVNKIILKAIKDSPNLLERQIQNQYKQILKYKFKRNKVIIIYQRLFAMYVFAYFKCDYDRIDVEVLCMILGIEMGEMRDFLAQLSKTFLVCLKEYGRCMGYSGVGPYSFENYVDLYVRASNGNRVLTLDMIGIKVCAIAHEKTKNIARFAKVFQDCYQDEAKEESLIGNQSQEWQSDEEQEGPLAIKSSQKAVTFFLGWINTISLIVECILYDRAEICLINDIEMKVPFYSEMYENQFKKLMLNVREISMHEIEAMGLYWFNKAIDKAYINKFTILDKGKKKLNVKEDVKGVPIKKQLCKSFKKAPDHFMRSSQQMEVEVTDQVRKWREIFFSASFLVKTYNGLISHLESYLKKDLSRYLREIASHLKVINLIFESDSEVLDDIIVAVVSFAEVDEKLKSEIATIFKKQGLEEIEGGVDKEKNEKRKEILKKKREEKMKIVKSKLNVQKFLQQNTNKQQENNGNETCIICHEQNGQNPLFYMSCTFLSNIAYSVLKTEGINPFFISCFHQVHEKCFLSIVSDNDRVACPLCKTYTNIILPTEQSMNDPSVLKISTERMEVIFAIQYKKSFDNLYVEIMKSFIQLFFSGSIDEGIINDRQVKLYKILFNILRFHYESLNQEQRTAFQNNILAFSSKYEKQSKEKYNFGLLMDFVFMIALKMLKKEAFTEEDLKIIVNHCSHLPRKDLISCNNLANRLFDLTNNLTPFFEGMDIQSQGKELKTFLYEFDPPKSIRALLEQRRKIQSQKICKMGHPICICLICAWKGCHDCGTCTVHTREVHNNDCLYFNFITGGFHHQYNRIQINIRSLYVNDLGIPWKPRFEDDAYFFEIDIYQKMSQALRSGNLIQMIRSNFEQLRMRDNEGWMTS